MAFFVAWAVGEGIVIWRSWRTQGGPPWPGQMMTSSGIFIALALLADAGPGARKAALSIAWGLNVAAWMNLGWTQAGTLPAKASTGWWTQVAKTSVGGDTVVLFGTGASAGCGAKGAPKGASPKVGTDTGSQPAGAGSKLSVPNNPVLKQGAGAPGLGVIAPVVPNPRDFGNRSTGPGQPGQTGTGAGFV